MGERIVQHAKWLRCTRCGALHMHRRGETVPTTPKTGFDKFT
jgi:hypothetical protein